MGDPAGSSPEVRPAAVLLPESFGSVPCSFGASAESSPATIIRSYSVCSNNSYSTWCCQFLRPSVILPSKIWLRAKRLDVVHQPGDVRWFAFDGDDDRAFGAVDPAGTGVGGPDVI